MALETSSIMSSAESTSPPLPHLTSPMQPFPLLSVRNPAIRGSPSASKPSSNSPSPSNLTRSPSFTTSDAYTGDPGPESMPVLHDVDLQIIEALRSKDRLYVLKLGESIESLVNERKPRIEVTPSTSYQRMLVYRCSEYYRVAPESEGGTKPIYVSLTPESRIPSRRISELVPAEETAQPAFKIMRRLDRSDQERRTKPHSQAGSVTGEDADSSDVEPSETGSFGGRSNATGSSHKQRMTIEEREAAYNKARSRIFMDFEEKEKEKDMSASSSTHSLVSGSSIGETDQTNGSAIESDSAAGGTRDRREFPRRNASTGSTRSLRSSAPAFNTNGTNSSHSSRPSSPGFRYYEPHSHPTAYDPSQPPGQPMGPGYMAPWGYPYSSGAQGPPPPGWFPPYPYYPPYPWPPQPNPSLPAPDPTIPANNEMYGPPPAPMGGYPWPPQCVWPSHTPPNQQPPPPVSHSRQDSTHHTPPPLPPGPQYPYMPPYPYPPVFYPGQPPPPNASMSTPPPMMNPPYISSEPLPSNGYMPNGSRNSHGHGNTPGPGDSRPSTRNSTGSGTSKRAAPPARSAWSYGPGFSAGNVGPHGSYMSGDVVGPRLSSTIRRTSGTSSAGSSVGTRTPAGDEASSTASSSTSSSSRRTYTSTASSQHPLPPRPDWAVGLRPVSTPSKHSRSSNHSRGHTQTDSSSSLQAVDFPPLSSTSAAPEKRTPAVAGAWSNASSMRSVMAPNNMHSQGTALVHRSAHAQDDLDDVFERPPPRSNAELFNPNVMRHTSGSGTSSPHPDRFEKEKERPKLDAGLAGTLAAMSLEDLGTSGNGSQFVSKEGASIAPAA